MSERKTCWQLTLPGYRFAMVSTTPLAHAEALECVRSIWPGAIDVE